MSKFIQSVLYYSALSTNFILLSICPLRVNRCKIHELFTILSILIPNIILPGILEKLLLIPFDSGHCWGQGSLMKIRIKA